MKRKIILPFLVGVFSFISMSDVNAETYKKYENGEAVYYNPVTGEKCNASEAVSTTGTKTGCMKWHTFNDAGENSSTVNMILDHNTTPLVAWNSSGDNKDGMNEVKTALESDTTGWKQTARLITADEIAEITGAKEKLKWTSDKNSDVTSPSIGLTISYFYFDGADGTDTTWKTKVANETTKSNYAWLFNNTDGCASYGCNVEDSGGQMGYWTSTPMIDDEINAWIVGYKGHLHYGYIKRTDAYGVRPVITVSKSLLVEDKDNSGETTDNTQDNNNGETTDNTQDNNSGETTGKNETNKEQISQDTIVEGDSTINGGTIIESEQIKGDATTENEILKEDTTTEKNPQTGLKNVGLGVLVFGLISLLSYRVIKNKKIFVK
ncbi:MAG: DUF1566 domain-containing protein [Lactobacillales bacterium]|nr:DUF1566 domain-containing protein [Lactobacillales bacterium]